MFRLSPELNCGENERIYFLHVHIRARMALWSTAWCLPLSPFYWLNWIPLEMLPLFRSAQKKKQEKKRKPASLIFSAKQMSPALRARPISRHNGHREPTHINTQFRSCRHGRSLSIRMRMCRWGLLPCKAKPWPFVLFACAFCIPFVSESLRGCVEK